MIKGKVRNVLFNIPLLKMSFSFAVYGRLLWKMRSNRCLTIHMSVITQSGEFPLMVALRRGETEVVSLLVKAGAALDLQDQVNMWH